MRSHGLLTATILMSAAWSQEAGEPGGPGLAILARKALVCELEGRVAVDNSVILIEDGKIAAVGGRRELDIPEGYEVLDVGDNWVAPGLIDLHNHTGASLGDLNDMVFLTNPGIRASAGAVPDNPTQKLALAAGVSSVLTIPGSGTNMGGQGVLMRTGLDGYEENLLRDPGSLKLAQAGNPERRAPWFPRRSFMNYNTRNTFRRGVAYARSWEEFEAGKTSERPEKDLQFEIFRSLTSEETQISTHTQIYQVVLMTITMVREEFGLPVYIDHGTFDGFRAGEKAEENGVAAILGPRAIQVSGFIDLDGRIQGVAAGYQERGVSRIGFNTDAPVIPQQELIVQAAMGVHYGFDDSEGDAVRGLTIVPATTAGLGDRLGSIEVGKDADLIICTGYPVDPRTAVEMVFQRGFKVYDTKEEKRRW